MHSVNSKLMAGILGLGLVTVWAAPRKSAPGRSGSVDRSADRAPAETVYVPTAPPLEAPASSFGSSSSSRDTEERRPRPFIVTGPARDFGQSYGLYGGFYNAEVLGNNPYANLYWDLFPGDQSYFFEFTSGIGTVQSSFSESVVGGGVFPHSFMITGEALGGYTYSGLARGPGRAGGLYPYFLAGIAAIYQGGIPNIGGVLGFGNRMNLPFGPKDGRWALNYGMRDHIYSQKIRTQPSMTQNFVLLIGVQKYY